MVKLEFDARRKAPGSSKQKQAKQKARPTVYHWPARKISDLDEINSLVLGGHINKQV